MLPAMFQPDATPIALFACLAAALARGERGALVTLVGREGSSVRSLGAHMAVLADGGFAGSFSGGCIEAAIVVEAQQAISDGRARTVRFGKGSRYIDIRLPCGGGVDLLFQPDPSPEAVQQIVALLGARAPAMLTLANDGSLAVESRWPDLAAGWIDDAFVVRHAPPLRLIVAGEGGETLALVRLARAYGAQVALMTPDADIAAAAAGEGADVTRLHSTSATPRVPLDPWTAMVLLFHSHEWETALLAEALAGPTFWIGAMGSQRTHQSRLRALAERGVPEAQRQRVRGPIGLIPATRDPATLALSALAEIVGGYQAIVT